MKPVVELLLATYNGERYLPELIDSLFTQTFSNWKLLIRDDGSKDGTVAYLTSLALNHPQKIVLIEDQKKGLGACQNFAALLKYCESNYVMFCDQDDVWTPTKIEKTLQIMQATEKSSDSSTPILVHTDLFVVKSDLHLISSSFWNYQNLNPKYDQINRLLIQNIITGCTVMVNHALYKRSLVIPEQAIMHDWWLGLVAASFGKIIPLHESTLYYRQHQSNQIGAKAWGLTSVIEVVKNISDTRKAILKGIIQAETFYKYFEKDLPPDIKLLLETYISFPKLNKFSRVFLIFKNQFYKIGLLRNLGFILLS